MNSVLLVLGRFPIECQQQGNSEKEIVYILGELASLQPDIHGS
jgi:hypothetical protein